MQLGESDPRSRIKDDDESTDRAVSPVIGVILMVAITVVLAGVIGVMVFGLADDLGSSGPTTTADGLNVSDADDDFGIYEFQHAGGDSLDEGDLVANAYDGSGSQVGANESVSGNLSSSESVTVSFDESGGGGSNVTITGDIADISSVDLVHEPSGTEIGLWEE